MQSETSRKFRPEDYSHEKLYYDDCYKIVGPDYVFHPSDVQIIVDYLIKKIKNQDMPLHWIKLANVYEIDPEKLADEYGQTTMKIWYFFTIRDRKYQNEKRSVSTIDGYWQVEGDDENIKENDETVGFRKKFQFYKGKSESSTKTCWIMYEFRAIDPLPPRYSHVEGQTKLEKDWVLCKICNTEIDSESGETAEDPDYVTDEEEAAP
ncbi:NAC domain-containing protein 55-like [Olea europaea var. sylvestris]|uniref:NAC transcription factor ONAC010-like n=1 Tax=Olea europaea subsp. europaea TaxID=158383 RepID=A0A8S0TYT4_OLEEU|nr:NAC domain-containing protein 55-like [Olea europaea var. sylvestris]CAA3011217.1 NAC transcription factor ONAC010-like [Olea europaea subsp. europaea]